MCHFSHSSGKAHVLLTLGNAKRRVGSLHVVIVVGSLLRNSAKTPTPFPNHPHFSSPIPQSPAVFEPIPAEVWPLLNTVQQKPHWSRSNSKRGRPKHFKTKCYNADLITLYNLKIWFNLILFFFLKHTTRISLDFTGMLYTTETNIFGRNQFMRNLRYTSYLEEQPGKNKSTPSCQQLCL